MTTMTAISMPLDIWTLCVLPFLSGTDLLNIVFAVNKVLARKLKHARANLDLQQMRVNDSEAASRVQQHCTRVTGLWTTATLLENLPTLLSSCTNLRHLHLEILKEVRASTTSSASSASSASSSAIFTLALASLHTLRALHLESHELDFSSLCSLSVSLPLLESLRIWTGNMRDDGNRSRGSGPILCLPCCLRELHLDTRTCLSRFNWQSCSMLKKLTLIHPDVQVLQCLPPHLEHLELRACYALRTVVAHEQLEFARVVIMYCRELHTFQPRMRSLRVDTQKTLAAIEDVSAIRVFECNIQRGDDEDARFRLLKPYLVSLSMSGVSMSASTLHPCPVLQNLCVLLISGDVSLPPFPSLVKFRIGGFSNALNNLDALRSCSSLQLLSFHHAALKILKRVPIALLSGLPALCELEFVECIDLRFQESTTQTTTQTTTTPWPMLRTLRVLNSNSITARMIHDAFRRARLTTLILEECNAIGSFEFLAPHSSTLEYFSFTSFHHSCQFKALGTFPKLRVLRFGPQYVNDTKVCEGFIAFLTQLEPTAILQLILPYAVRFDAQVYQRLEHLCRVKAIHVTSKTKKGTKRESPTFDELMAYQG